MADEPMDDRQCFEILELDSHATLATVKQAYRDLISIWHPDRYAHNDRLQKKAEEKTKEINAAYGRVKTLISERKNRGIRMQNHSGEKSSGHSKSVNEEKNDRADAESKQETWARTESRLAEMARQKRAAADRQAYFSRMEAKEKAKKPDNLYTEKKASVKQNHGDVEKAADKKKAREKIKEKERKRVWLAAEAKLRKLADAKAESLAGSQTFAGEKKDANSVFSEKPIILIRPVPLAIFCCAVILFFFFAGIVQNYTRVNLFVIIILTMATFFGSYVLVKQYTRKSISFSLRVTVAVCSILLLICALLFILSSDSANYAMHTVQAIFTLK